MQLSRRADLPGEDIACSVQTTNPLDFCFLGYSATLHCSAQPLTTFKPDIWRIADIKAFEIVLKEPLQHDACQWPD